MDESTLADHAARIGALEREFSEIRDDVKLTRVCVQRLEVQLATASSRQHCAAPSLCLSLQPRIADLETRMRDLESERDKATGGAKVILAGVSLIAGTVGASVLALIQHLLKKP